MTTRICNGKAVFLLLSLWFLPFAVLAQGSVQQTIAIAVPEAEVRGAPEESARVLSTLKQGRRLKWTGEEQNGFYKVQARSGRALWVRADDVSTGSERRAVEADLEGGDPVALSPRQAAPSSGPRFDPRLTFDLGVSAGSVGNRSYTEASLGLNLYFFRWLAWRNAGFYRFVSESDNIYGLDSSVRGILALDMGALGLTAFAGPGYRFVNLGRDVPFGEAGAVFRLAGFAIGGGLKTFWNKAVDRNLENDTQYFIILSGAGSL